MKRFWMAATLTAGAMLLAAVTLFAPSPAAAKPTVQAQPAVVGDAAQSAPVILAQGQDDRGPRGDTPPWLRKDGKGPDPRARGPRGDGPRARGRRDDRPRARGRRDDRPRAKGRRGDRPRARGRRADRPRARGRRWSPPRYSRHRHGRRGRRKSRNLRFFFDGWWYATQWWLPPITHGAPYGSCGYWEERCIDNWGYRNPDFYGCMRYYGCR